VETQKEKRSLLFRIGKDLKEYWALYGLILIVLGIIAFFLDKGGVISIFPK